MAKKVLPNIVTCPEAVISSSSFVTVAKAAVTHCGSGSKLVVVEESHTLWGYIDIHVLNNRCLTNL